MELHLDSFPTLRVQTRIVEIFDARYKLTTEWYSDYEPKQYVWLKIINAEGDLILSIQRQADDIFHHEVSVNRREYLLIGIPFHPSILINLTENNIRFSPDNFTWMEGAISPDEKTLIVGGSCSNNKSRYVFYEISGDKIDRIEGNIITYLRKDDDDTFTTARWLNNDKVEIRRETCITRSYLESCRKSSLIRLMHVLRMMKLRTKKLVISWNDYPMEINFMRQEYTNERIIGLEKCMSKNLPDN